ncbi:MAG: eight transrane protein EpsH [Deltaproteobacteria bacterium]|nr:eight transrane protein EpsH [Deltaproteobacteria bacterium]
MINSRNILFVILTLAAIVMIYEPMAALLSNRMLSDYYSHIALIPIVSAYLIASNRREIFARCEYRLTGALISLLGMAGYWWGRTLEGDLSLNDHTSLLTFAALVFWVGGFFWIYGRNALRSALFPLVFLIFMVPIPEEIMNRIIYILQVGSTEVTYLFFNLIGIPVAREGFIFHLPGVSIEVAKQCSGIRSSLGLFITGVLACHFFLKSNLSKGILLAAIYPLTIFKNGVRIVTLTLLAIYVDEGFLTGGFLHRSGGFVFYIPALAIMGVILMGLRRGERNKLKGS